MGPVDEKSELVSEFSEFSDTIVETFPINRAMLIIYRFWFRSPLVIKLRTSNLVCMKFLNNPQKVSCMKNNYGKLTLNGLIRLPN